MKNIINGWIARDKDYRLHFFRTKPQKYEDCGEWSNGGERYLIPSEFSFIGWNDEPQKVKMTIWCDNDEQS